MTLQPMAWGRILKRTFQEYLRDDGPFLSAGIAFYALFSLFPMALIGVSVLGYLLPADMEAQRFTLDMANYYLPPNVVNYLESSVKTLGRDRGKLGAFGILVLLWSGRHLFRALELGLHRAWEMPRNRNFISGNLISILMMILSAIVTFAVFLLSAFLTWVQTLISHWKLPTLFGLSLDQTLFWSAVHSWVVIPLATLLIFLLLYMILPSQQVPVAHAMPGALFATVAWKLCTWVYVTFIITLLQINPIYGSMWSLAGLMIWLYMGAAVFLVGAELVHVLYADARTSAPMPSRRPRKKKVPPRRDAQVTPPGPAAPPRGRRS